MISARYKLNISLALRDFKAFYKGKFFSVKRKENGLKVSRVGVVISKKFSRSAVKRNKIRRSIFRFFQENKTFLLRFNPPSDFLVIVLTTTSEIEDNKEILTKELKNVISI